MTHSRWLHTGSRGIPGPGRTTTSQLEKEPWLSMWTWPGNRQEKRQPQGLYESPLTPAIWFLASPVFCYVQVTWTLCHGFTSTIEALPNSLSSTDLSSCLSLHTINSWKLNNSSSPTYNTKKSCTTPSHAKPTSECPFVFKVCVY